MNNKIRESSQPRHLKSSSQSVRSAEQNKDNCETLYSDSKLEIKVLSQSTKDSQNNSKSITNQRNNDVNLKYIQQRRDSVPDNFISNSNLKSETFDNVSRLKSDFQKVPASDDQSVIEKKTTFEGIGPTDEKTGIPLVSKTVSLV